MLCAQYSLGSSFFFLVMSIATLLMLPWSTPTRREETLLRQLFDNLILLAVCSIKFLSYGTHFFQTITNQSQLNLQPTMTTMTCPNKRNIFLVQPLFPNKRIFHLHLKRRKWRGILSGRTSTWCSANGCSETEMESFPVKIALRFPLLHQKIEFVRGWSGTRTALRTKYSRGMTKTRSMCRRYELGKVASSIHQWWTAR